MHSAMILFWTVRISMSTTILSASRATQDSTTVLSEHLSQSIFALQGIHEVLPINIDGCKPVNCCWRSYHHHLSSVKSCPRQHWYALGHGDDQGRHQDRDGETEKGDSSRIPEMAPLCGLQVLRAPDYVAILPRKPDVRLSSLDLETS